MKSIESIIDINLERWVSAELNAIPSEVPSDMYAGEGEDDWVYWKPVESKITDEDIDKLQNDLSVVFPPSFRRLLKHKHFLELHVGEVEIYSNPSEGWQYSISQGIFDSWPRELLIDKGYMPFANYSDWGLWCFNLNEPTSEGEFPVYLWDHEEPNKFKLVASSFVNALNAEYEKSKRA